MIMVLVVGGLVAWGTAHAEMALSDEQQVSTGPAAPEVVDAGNTLCPVSADPVDGVSVYVYEGKSYNLCCPMCAEMFAKDPVRYSAIADMQPKDAGEKE